MKLKTRLIIAFFVIICVPLLLAGVSLVGFSTYQIRNLEDHLGISGVTYENMSDSVQVLNKATNSNFEQIKAKGSENPDAFLNRDYLDQLNDTWRWHLQESVCSITKKKCVLYLYKKKESGLWAAGFFLFSHMRQNTYSRNPGFCVILDTEDL